MSLAWPLLSAAPLVHSVALVLVDGNNFTFPAPQLPDGVKTKLDLLSGWGAGFTFWAIGIVALVSIGLMAFSKLAHHRMAGVFGVSGIIVAATAALLTAVPPGILTALAA